MLKDTTKQESRTDSIKNESTRQRWELFHQAIAHAKKSNFMALEDIDDGVADEHRPVPLTTVAS